VTLKEAVGLGWQARQKLSIGERNSSRAVQSTRICASLAALEKGSNGVIAFQSDGSAKRTVRLIRFAQTLENFGSCCPVRLILPESWICGELVQCFERD
jgi:hypothetical protein